jgi:hypothetical protein
MTMEPVWTLLLDIALWLLDPVPWLVIVLAMLFLSQRLGSRRAFLVSVVLGGVAGFAVMCSIGGCEGASPGSLSIAAFRAVSAACIVTLVVAGLLKLGQRWADPDRESN